MIRASTLKPHGTYTGQPDDTIVLDFDARHRRRIALVTTHGIVFLLDLPAAPALRNGDALLLADGRLVEIVAAAEPLVEIRCADPAQLARIAWHLGNRHLPVEILARSLRIRRDHVIEAMLTQLGAKLQEIEAPFTPESGAYAAHGATAELAKAARPTAHGHHDHAHHDHANHDHARHGLEHHDHDHHGHGHHDRQGHGDRHADHGHGHSDHAHSHDAPAHGGHGCGEGCGHHDGPKRQS
jgi:urease accessory protein